MGQNLSRNALWAHPTAQCNTPVPATAMLRDKLYEQLPSKGTRLHRNVGASWKKNEGSHR